MQAGCWNASTRLFAHVQSLSRVQRRQISLTSAIEKGIRKGTKAVERERPTWVSARDQAGTDDDPSRRSHDFRSKRRSAADSDEVDAENGRRSDHRSKRSLGDAPEAREDVDHRSAKWERPPKSPMSIPYTQADSQFLYGTFAITAALNARRRQLRKLYILTSDADTENSEDSDSVERPARRIKELEIKKVSGPNWQRLLDKMSESRPHNGYVLEAAPLPMANLSALPADTSAPTGTTTRFPLYLFLDRIVDPGNLGSILRSAYFFGVDGVILLTHDSAPLSAITVKASAGAAEYIPLYRVSDEMQFIQKSQANGWKFFGAFAEPESGGRGRHRSRRDAKDNDGGHAITALSEHPSVLVLGNESTGLRTRIARKMDQTINIGTSAAHPGIDSLNVGVAAAILIRDFMTTSPASKQALFA
jgi:21S rRNA (GM2251-2'-O)-methyltransferase